MNAIPYEGQPDDWDRYGDDDEIGGELPGRPRRQLLNRWSALLLAVILAGGGFLAGTEVEKGQVSSTSSPAASAFARLAAGGTARASGSRGGAATSGAAGSRGSFAGGGFAGGGFAGAFGRGGSAAVGTVSSVSGNTLYVTETDGNTVEVHLSSATKISKDETVSKGKIYPGDTVIAGGSAGRGGAVTATTLTDSGARTRGSSTGSGSGSSAVSSLFGG